MRINDRDKNALNSRNQNNPPYLVSVPPDASYTLDSEESGQALNPKSLRERILAQGQVTGYRVPAAD